MAIINMQIKIYTLPLLVTNVCFHSQVLLIMVHHAMTAQSSAHTQNHLWVLNKLITVVKTLQQQGFKFKHIVCTFYIKFQL